MILSDLVKRVRNGEHEQRSENVVPETVVEGEEKKREEGEEQTEETEDETAKTALKSMKTEIMDLKGWENADSSVCELVIGSNCCNEVEVKIFDLGKFTNLKSIKIGDECFKNVKVVKVIGLSQLEIIEIGKDCFRRNEDEDKSGHFSLENCERLRELRIGPFAFKDYSVCIIENVPSLEVIEMGDMDHWSGIMGGLDKGSGSFFYSSLELKSEDDRLRS